MMCLLGVLLHNADTVVLTWDDQGRGNHLHIRTTTTRISGPKTTICVTEIAESSNAASHLPPPAIPWHLVLGQRE